MVSEETRRKMSEARKKWWAERTPEEREEFGRRQRGEKRPKVSAALKGQAKSEAHREAMRQARRTGVTLPCSFCGEPVYVQRNRLAKSKAHYCNKQCQAGGSRRATYNTYICETCGNTFKRSKAREKHSAIRYCSRLCAEKGRVGKNHPYWSGGKQKRGDGYIDVAGSLIPEEFVSMQRKDGRVFEHRLVMAQHLGRPLEKHEVVHHINGDRSDNRIENLELYPRYTHDGITQAGAAKDREIAALKSQIANLQARLNELEAENGESTDSSTPSGVGTC